MDRPQQEKIRECVDRLAANPKPLGARTLASHSEFWRIKVGDFRVIYTIEEGVLTVQVVKVAHRREDYRQVSRL